MQALRCVSEVRQGELPALRRVQWVLPADPPVFQQGQAEEEEKERQEAQEANLNSFLSEVIEHLTVPSCFHVYLSCFMIINMANAANNN